MNTAAPDLLTWHPFHTSHWPSSIVHPSEYDGGERLRLSWDLGLVTEKDKKRAIKEWCAKLPALKHLRWLSIWSLTTQPLLNAACAAGGLECLQIKWSNAKTLDSIRDLHELRYLHIGSSTKIESIEPLASLRNLRLLELENFKLITEFSPLLALTSLESLVVSGSMWARQDVGSLAPFAQMTWLKSLAIDTTRVKSLRPLASLRQLQCLDLGGKLPVEEYAWLSAKLPHTECRWFAPYLDVSQSGFLPCERCKEHSKVMLTGKGGGVVCRHCDTDKIRRHEQLFAAARQRGAEE